MNGPIPTVHVVDDDASFLKAVARLLRAAGHTVETFASGPDLLARLERPAAGCILADLKMPGMSGLELQAAVSGCPSPLPIVFLTGHGEVPDSVRAMKQGAEDFLAKTAPKRDLLEAIARAMARGAAESAADARHAEGRARYERLTPRERQVLAHVLRGLLNKQIAGELSIHERTVKLHRTSITTKIGLASVAELSHWAHEAGLMPELEALAATRPKGQ